jgi:hypothetical protein
MLHMRAHAISRSRVRRLAINIIIRATLILDEAEQHVLELISVSGQPPDQLGVQKTSRRFPAPFTTEVRNADETILESAM